MSEFETDKAPRPVGPYPHARRAGHLLFLSGIGPRRPESDEIPGNIYNDQGKLLDYDFEAQCRSVFDNVRVVLECSGSSWLDLVDVTVFLTNMQRDFETYNYLYKEYFAENRPCRTTVEVVSLPTQIAIELKCIAWINQKD